MALEYSPARKKRRAKAKYRQEKRWKDKNGPVVIRKIKPNDVGSTGKDGREDSEA